MGTETRAADELEGFRAEARAFLDAHAEPRTDTDADWSRGAVMASGASSFEFMQRCRQWQRTLFDNGWAGITWPERFGGRGGTVQEAIAFDEEAARYDVTNGFVAVSQSLVGPALMTHGSPEQQDRHLRPLLRGDVLWCQLFSEPSAGSDLASLATRAERDGAEYVITGQKVWTSEAQHCDLGILIARTDPDVPKHKGITFFIVDMSSPGVDVRPLRQATGHTQFNEVFLDEVRVPVSDVVGEVDGGWSVTRTVMSNEAGMIGGSLANPADFSEALRLARELGRHGEPVIRQALAKAYTGEELQRLLALRLRTFIMGGGGQPPDPSLLKNAHTRSNAHIADLGLALQAPAGMLSGEDSHADGLWQVNALAQFMSRIGGGTEEVHRNMIAERALGLPRDHHGDRDIPWRELSR